MLSTLFARSIRETPAGKDLGLLLLRLWFGVVLALGHGLQKLGDVSGFTASVARLGMPLPGLSGPFAVASEFFGGLLLAVGLFTRPAAIAVAATLAVAALWVHADDPFIKKELGLAYAVAALCVFVAGPGRYSADAWLAMRLRR